MSGRRIDDHKFFAGGMSKESVLPKGVHVKSMDNEAHGGGLSNYEDTNEKIESQQKMSVSKAKSHAQKPGYRY